MSLSRAAKEAVRSTGGALGLDAIGFAPALPNERTEFVRTWWEQGYGGDLAYIGRRLDERADPREVLPGAKSIIAVGLLCAPDPDSPERRPDEHSTARGRIARYAGGDDYHEVLLERVRALAAALPALVERDVETKAYVDTGPVVERAAAEAAGLGWIGKNSCLIHPELGSHLMLGVLLTDLEFEPDPVVADHCGTCRACLDVCPTDAFAAPYVLDATRCLSYTTIEKHGEIPVDLREGQGDHVFGCDLCQTVCPWNRSRPREFPPDPLGLRERLEKREAWVAPRLADLLGLSEEDFLLASRKTALRRTGRERLLRNTLVAAGNSGDATLLPMVEAFAEGDDPSLAEHARWALERLRPDEP